MDKRNLYAPLRRPEDFALTWPLLSHEMPDACNKNCNQGRACDCVPDVATKDAEDADMHAGMGAIVIPAAVAFVLAVAAFVAFVLGVL